MQAVFDYPVLLNIGRLEPQKGHIRLINIFEKIHSVQSGLKLVILGEGGLLCELISLCHSLSLKVFSYDREEAITTDYDVYFFGFQKNPYSFLKASTLFLFPSLYEGFGIAIIEAMFCGLPVIASDCDFGPREIISPNSSPHFRTDKPEATDYGILMPSFHQVINGNSRLLNKQLENVWAETVLSYLIESEDKNDLFPGAVKRAEEFDINNLIVDWENLINGQYFI
jgi:glycosyltransferase involved in cell wall biosynthesis